MHRLLQDEGHHQEEGYPLSLISHLIDQIAEARIYSCLDIPDAYHLVHVHEGNEWKNAFRCNFGRLQYNVVSFGLFTTPAAFQSFMDDIFKDMHNEFLVIYLDDLLIYSQDLHEHDSHIGMVLSHLRQHSLMVNPDKCSFDITEINFLGHIVSPTGISMDLIKSDAGTSWKPQDNVKDV
jgi:hypothetical protein